MKFKIQFLLMTLLILPIGEVFSQMIILSGPEKGSYNQFVNDIVSVLGEKGGISLINQSTSGSAYNFKKLTDSKSNYKIALIQSDYLSLMEAEDRLNNTHKTDSIKIVMQLATEEIHLIAKNSSGLTSLQYLDNKKVGIGNEDQGSFATGNLIRERSKINWDTYQVSFDQMLKKLSAGSIDVGLVVGSAPVSLLDIDPQVMADGISLLELNDFNDWAKYYENDTIYRSDYKWLEKDVPTFGVRTLLIVNTSKLTSDDQLKVAAIKSGIIENLDQLRKQGHPKWRTVIIPDGPVIEIKNNAVMQKTPVPVISESEDKVIYRVQIYSRNYKREDQQITINDKSYHVYVYSYLGAYRYTIGEFTSLSDAVDLQNSSRKAGYSQAFVAVFKNNIRSTEPILK